MKPYYVNIQSRHFIKQTIDPLIAMSLLALMCITVPTLQARISIMQCECMNRQCRITLPVNAALYIQSIKIMPEITYIPIQSFL